MQSPQRLPKADSEGLLSMKAMLVPLSRNKKN